MKQNLTFTLCYFICFGIAIFTHPANMSENFNHDALVKSIKKEIPVAREDVDILHGELLLKF